MFLALLFASSPSILPSSPPKTTRNVNLIFLSCRHPCVLTLLSSSYKNLTSVKCLTAPKDKYLTLKALLSLWAFTFYWKIKMLNLSIRAVGMEFQGRVWGGCGRVITCPGGHSGGCLLHLEVKSVLVLPNRILVFWKKSVFLKKYFNISENRPLKTGLAQEKSSNGTLAKDPIVWHHSTRIWGKKHNREETKAQKFSESD